MLQWRLKIIHIGYEDKIIGGVDFLAVHERAFYGPLWTKLLGKSLFHGVHQHLYGIVAEQAFIPRCWTHPNSLADYLAGAESNKWRGSQYRCGRVSRGIKPPGSPPANLGVFSNGKWTPVPEQCHTTVHERVKEALGQQFCSERAIKSTFMNGKKIHSTNDFVGGVDFFAVDERLNMNVHEQWHSDVDERLLKCIWWTMAH